MPWNANTNTWTFPTKWQAPAASNVMGQFQAATPGFASMTAAQKKAAFENWWIYTGNQSVMNAWNTEAGAWDETYSGWQADPELQTPFAYGGTYTKPELPTFTGIQSWQQQQLYGGAQDNPNTAVDESQGIYDILENLANQLQAGSAQYNDEWIAQYAEQAGFTDPQAREDWLLKVREEQKKYQANQVEMLANLKSGQATPEQQKEIRKVMADQEAKSRRQAEASYQETGSYAALQRASDEINRSQVADTVKMSMDMALQNFSAAMSAVEQQTNVLMREMESGTKSFNDYVSAKQYGINAAMGMWQDRAAQVLTEAQQKMDVAQANFDNQGVAYEADYAREKALYDQNIAFLNQQGQAILDARNQFLGMGTATQAANEYYNMFLEPLINQWEDEVLDPSNPLSDEYKSTHGVDETVGWLSTAAGAFMIIVGIAGILFSPLTFGATGGLGQGLIMGGVGLMGTGGGLIVRD